MTGPRNATTTTKGRTYKWVTGEEFTSVTTILRDGIPKPALVAWGPKMVAEYVAANPDQVMAVLRPNGKVTEQSKKAAIDLLKGAPYRERDVAADIGTLVHDIAEARALDLPTPPFEDRHAGFVRSFDAFLEEWQPTFQFSEMTVYNRTHRYAGTLDFIADVPGLGRVLGDYKTSKPGKQGHGIYPECACQLAAYRYAEFAGMPNGTEVPMPEVDRCIAVNLRPNGYKVVECDSGPETFRTFLYCAQIAEFQRDGARLVSSPLAPPSVEAVA